MILFDKTEPKNAQSDNAKKQIASKDFFTL